MTTTRHIVAILVLSLAGALPVAAGNLQTVSREIDSPKVAEARPFSQTLTLGRAQLKPGEGASLRTIYAGDMACGVVVEGPAVLVLPITDPMSVPVAQRNIKRASHLDVTATSGGLELQAPLEGAVIWSWNMGAKADGDGQPAGQLPDWASEILERPFFSHPSHELLAGRDGGAGDVVYALLHGDKDDLLLSVDPGVAREESLYVVDKLDSRSRVDEGRWYAEELVTQPMGRKWWDRPVAPLVAVDEKLAVTNTSDEHVVVDATMKLEATRGGLSLWRTNLRQRTVEHSKENPVTVRSVKVDGTPASFLHQDGELLVQLPRRIAARGNTVTVRVVSEGELAIHPGGDSYWSLGTWAWYPQPPLNGELATVEITVDVPEGWTPFASGTTLERVTKGGRTHLRTRVGHPVQFPVVAAGKYKVYSEDKQGIHCDVASYVFGKESACRRLIQNFYAATEVYKRLYGHPYPFEEMNIVEVNTWGFGQAPPGVIFITKEAYNPLGETLSQLFSQGVNERLVHEIAHSWWGHLIKMDSSEEQWITESFAEYSAALCLEAVSPSRRKGKREFKKLLDHWKGQTSMIKDGGSIYLANHLAMHDSVDSADRTRLLYSKGPLVLHALRLELRRKLGSERDGDRYFFALMRSFLKNFPYQWGPTRHLVGILNQITKEDWQPWFDRYVYGCETPKI